MIAWVALALAGSLWLTLAVVVVSVARAARDPRTLTKVMQRMLPKPKPFTTTTTGAGMRVKWEVPRENG